MEEIIKLIEECHKKMTKAPWTYHALKDDPYPDAYFVRSGLMTVMISSGEDGGIEDGLTDFDAESVCKLRNALPKIKELLKESQYHYDNGYRAGYYDAEIDCGKAQLHDSLRLRIIELEDKIKLLESQQRWANFKEGDMK